MLKVTVMAGMSDEEIRILMDIKDKLTEINQKLENIKDGLASDRSWVWKILALTIAGAFALVGIKIALP